MNNTSICKKCGAPIVWLTTPRGKKMPADAVLREYKENPEGKNSVLNDLGEVIKCDLQFEGTPTGLARIPHWATCPNADEFRRRGGRYGR